MVYHLDELSELFPDLEDKIVFPQARTNDNDYVIMEQDILVFLTESRLPYISVFDILFYLSS